MENLTQVMNDLAFINAITYSGPPSSRQCIEHLLPVITTIAQPIAWLLPTDVYAVNPIVSSSFLSTAYNITIFIKILGSSQSV